MSHTANRDALPPPTFAAESQRPRGRQPSAPPPKTGRRRRLLDDVPILVVEDDVLSAKLAGLVLGAEGATVRLAASAEEGLAVLREFKPRVVLLDIVLPRMSGLVLAKHIKSDERTRDTFIVAVTAFNGPEAKRVAEEAGCDAYIRKPIDVETFARTVASYLVEKR